MIEEKAIVIAVENQPSTPNLSVATLEIVRKTACGLCGKTRGCGNALWGKMFAHRSATFRANNDIQANVGQFVVVGINEKALLKSAMYLYLIPMISMLVFAVLAMQLFQSDAAAIFGALVGLLLGWLWVKGYTSSNSYFAMHQPVILRLDNDDAVIKLHRCD